MQLSQLKQDQPLPEVSQNGSRKWSDGGTAQSRL
jgi:hypothetical protein